jgi:hypothetical protein
VLTACYNWSFKLVRLFLGFDPPSNPTPAGSYINGKYVTVNNKDKLLVNFAGPSRTIPPTYSASFIALGNYFPDWFRNKIVLIGSTSLTLQDFFPTPFSPSSPAPGVEVVANSVATILLGNYLQKAPPWTAIILIILAAMINVIHKHGGTLGKHEGDAIGAFFGELIHYYAHAYCAIEVVL